MRQGFFTFSALTGAETREEKFLDRDYLVVPVVALVQGVIQASNSPQPELALASEFAKVPAAWDGRPIVMNHPKNNQGVPVSANSPEILAKYQFGFMFNTKLIDNAAKKPSLYTEAWLDTARVKEMGGDVQDTLDRINAGEQIEVSTGLYSTTHDQLGEFDGKAYSAIWRDVMPDHLAFLSKGKIGACSIEDGCGAMRTNDTPNVQIGNMQPGPKTPTLEEVLATQNFPGADTGGPADTPPVPMLFEQYRNHVKVSECGCSVVFDPIEITLNAKDPYGDVEYADPGYQSDKKKRYPIDTAAHIRAAWNYINMPKNSKKYSSTQVASIKRKIIAAWKAKIDKKGPPSARNSELAMQDLMDIRANMLGELLANSYPDDMTDSDIRQLVGIALGQVFDGYCYLQMFDSSRAIFSWYDSDTYEGGTYSVPFTLDDGGKVTFTGMATRVAVLTRIVPVQQSEVGADSDPDQDGDVDVDDPTDPDAPINNEKGNDMTKKAGEGAPETITITNPAQPEVRTNETPRVLSAAEYIANAPAEVRAALEESMRVMEQKKAGLIKQIKDCGRCEFDDAELAAMDIKGLERIAKLANAPSFAGQAAPRQNAGQPDTNEGKIPAPLKVFENGNETYNSAVA